MRIARAALGGLTLSIALLAGCAADGEVATDAPEPSSTTTSTTEAPPTTERETTTTTSTSTTTTTTAPPTTLPPTTTTTAPPPPPTPAPSGCDPNYTGCVPIASDVDCAGGSGNGPAYTGYVQVIGSDIYDLDRDGDGEACE